VAGLRRKAIRGMIGAERVMRVLREWRKKEDVHQDEGEEDEREEEHDAVVVRELVDGHGE
jgi:hypothetical protein